MIAFAHYGAEKDISGVTTWLGLLVAEVKKSGFPIALHLEHFGDDGSNGSLFSTAVELGISTSWVQRSGDTFQDVKGVLEFINRVRPAVFLPQCLPSCHFAARLAQRHGLPWVFTMHSDDPAYWALAETSGPDARHGIWVCVSEAIADEARKRYPKADIRVIPYGVKIPEEKTVWNPDRFRIVYSGRLVEEQKRVSKVIEVLIHACQGSPRVEAVVMGDGPGRDSMESRVRSAGLDGRIRFTGRLVATEVGHELKHAHSIVLMSDFEGLPVSLLEAMACGVVPVVRSIRSGIPEIVRPNETGILVGEDPIQAAADLLFLSDSPGAWEAMSAAARALVSDHYSEAVCHVKWHGVLNELIARTTVKYPIPLPRKAKLPPFDVRLKNLDFRKPNIIIKMSRGLRSFGGRITRRICRPWR
jgi:colanic acid/amylovoran biosynthesis glycosyltransferase